MMPATMIRRDRFGLPVVLAAAAILGFAASAALSWWAMPRARTATTGDARLVSAEGRREAVALRLGQAWTDRLQADPRDCAGLDDGPATRDWPVDPSLPALVRVRHLGPSRVRAEFDRSRQLEGDAAVIIEADRADALCERPPFEVPIRVIRN